MSSHREEDASSPTETGTETARATATEATTSLDELLPDAARLAQQPTASSPHAAPAPAPATQPEPRVRTARLVAVRGREADVIFRRARTPVACEIGQEVETALLEDALKNGGSVLVEESGEPGEQPVIAGVIATRFPRVIELKASSVVIEGERELLLRSGRGAIRIREDGDIEVVGTRISATSRGLFRLVGRLLRLN